MRFGMRSGTDLPSERADLYGAAIDMCEWADSRNCLASILSQHHGAEDGYLPSPIPMAAAIAGRTSSLSIVVAALLVALYEPVKLAEDMAVVDLISRGRVSYVVGIGYRDEEFAAFGVDRRRRASLVEERIGLLRQLWDGRSAGGRGKRRADHPTAVHTGRSFLVLRRRDRGRGPARRPSRFGLPGREGRSGPRGRLSGGGRQSGGPSGRLHPAPGRCPTHRVRGRRS